MQVAQRDHRDSGSVQIPFTIDLSGLNWEPAGGTQDDEDPYARLLAVVNMLGCNFHLEAVEVDEDGMAVDPQFENVIDGMTMISKPDKPFHDVEIEGRRYVVTMTPFIR